MIKYFIGFLAGLLLWVVILYHIEIPQYKVYNCDIAEFHPDIPLQVKKDCRKLRNQHERETQTGIHEDRESLCQSKLCT